ncbi:glycosyltransferase family 4 protein [Providencia stuartii]|uniref:glycosyltransferase family 4 protein n=1 Tax=Providencia stuartii TaxID=588 RepID=UPI0030F26C02
MEKNKIIVLHEYGANEHYVGLSSLAKEHNSSIIYREFSCIRQLVSGIIHLKYSRIKRSIVNFIFLVKLMLTKNKKIILGMAPLDYRMLFISKILKRHHFYYHTSWPYWNFGQYPKDNFLQKKIKQYWGEFLLQSEQIFCVTEQAKKSLIDNKLALENRISVVYHSYNQSIFYKKEKKYNNKLKLLFVGRLEPEKGIRNIIEIAEALHDVELNIIGNGSLSTDVIDAAKNNNNINYIGYVSDKNKLAEYMRESHFLLLPSKIRSDGWQELFGMVIIEALACGCIPISTNHVGPTEILSKYPYLLLSEDNYTEKASSLISFDLIKKCNDEGLFSIADSYALDEIKEKWKKIYV